MLENNSIIDLCNANIDTGTGESKSAMSIKVLHKKTENKIEKEKQNFMKELEKWNKKKEQEKIKCSQKRN